MSELQDKSRISGIKIATRKGLIRLENTERKYRENEIIPFAKNTPFLEIAERVIPDKDGPWEHDLYFFRTRHVTTIGSHSLCRKTKKYLEMMMEECPMDILSITAGMEGDQLCTQFLVRSYGGQPNMKGLFSYLGERKRNVSTKQKKKLIIPEEAINHYTEDDYKIHSKLRAEQDLIYKNSTEEVPFLNSIDHYIMKDLTEIDEGSELTYDLLTKDMQISTILEYKEFIKVFQSCMQYVSGVEKDTYYSVIRGAKKRDEFDMVLESYIQKNFIDTKILPKEDLPALQKKLDRALFQLYIVQDLIDDPDITDVKITAPDSIRVRVGGKAYLSNITFIDRNDYVRFINSIAVKNNVDLKVPSQTFTDEHDQNFILRFSVTAPYISGTGLPIIHIRKVARRKLLSDDLIAAGMFDEKIRDYLIDRGRDKNSMGIVFAGPPGSGKTVCLNWYLEDAYEQSAEILVIQENDELFAYRRGVMFEHVVNNPQKGERPCSLEDLGQMALVAGANVFIIGEAKGGEICSAITLSNSGCRTALTIHSTSSQQTIDKMADLAMRGYANSYDQAKRMIVSFKTIVYLQDFKVKEITEIVGTDDEGFPVYKMVYKNPAFAEKKQNKKKGDTLGINNDVISGSSVEVGNKRFSRFS